MYISDLPREIVDPPPCISSIVKGSPIPRSKLNSGPPKQALKPVLGEPRLAIVVSAIMSPMEFPDWSTFRMQVCDWSIYSPQARTVRPRMALLRPNITPKARSTLTSSLAMT